MAPTTAVRAQVKYSKRFRDAYDPHRSRAGVLHRSSTTVCPAPSKTKPHDALTRLPVTTLKGPNDHRTIPSFSAGTPPNPNCADPRDDGRQEVHWRHRRPVKGAHIWAAVCSRVYVLDAVDRRNHHTSGHRCTPLGTPFVASAPDPFSAAPETPFAMVVPCTLISVVPTKSVVPPRDGNQYSYPHVPCIILTPCTPWHLGNHWPNPTPRNKL